MELFNLVRNSTLFKIYIFVRKISNTSIVKHTSNKVTYSLIEKLCPHEYFVDRSSIWNLGQGRFI